MPCSAPAPAVPDCHQLKHADGLHICRYVKFDTFHPAVEKGLPVTRVISRVTLQQILAKACTRVAGEDVILNDCRVVDYVERVRQPSKDCALHSTDKVLACAHSPCVVLEGSECCLSSWQPSVQRRIRKL